jgi:hypothetical protein
MELTHRTPKLIPGAWYVTYTNDDQMLPVYVQPINIEPDSTGVWRATFRDTKLGEFEVREGEKRFAFYARVAIPIEDRMAPQPFDKGELFEMAEERREVLVEQRALQAKLDRLNIARMTAGGTR